MLLSNLNLLATAPDGVARLRELILTLAVQGKLVPQDPSDEPASVLLKKIRAEKDRLIAEGRIKRDKPLAEIAEEETPFELPTGWASVRLPEIYYSISPSGSKLLSSAAKEEGDYPVVDQGQRPIAGYTNDRSLLIEIPGPVIVFGDHTKAIKHIDFNFVAGADSTKILRPVLQDERFFASQLRSFSLEDRGYARHFKVLNSHLFALPPLAEQSRIANRVEELMRLCDALEAKARLEAMQHAQLVATLLSALTASTTPEELTENWHRVASHFDLLLDRPAAVDALEQTILQLAVRGLLVPQDPKNEPASALLQKIRTEKDRLIAQGKIKRDKPLPPIAEDEKPFELPKGWEWLPVGEVVEMLNRYAFKSEWFKTKGTRLLRNLNVGRGWVDWSAPAFIDNALAREYEQFALSAGDIVLTLDRPIISTGLKLAVLRERDLPCLLLQRVARLSPDTRALSQEFLVLWMQSDAFIGTLDPGRSNGVPHISTKQVASMAFPLPPLAEQSRIVARVAALRALCADLRQRLATARTQQALLAESLIANV